MAIEIVRVPGLVPFLHRYTLRVSPPHADTVWESTRPMTHRQVQNKLYDFGNHTADIADAFVAAETRWRSARS